MTSLHLLEDTILGNVGAALEDLSATTIEYGSIDFRGIGGNRRLPKDGKITWGPYAEGSFDSHTHPSYARAGTSRPSNCW